MPNVWYRTFGRPLTRQVSVLRLEARPAIVGGRFLTVHVYVPTGETSRGKLRVSWGMLDAISDEAKDADCPDENRVPTIIIFVPARLVVV